MRFHPSLVHVILLVFFAFSIITINSCSTDSDIIREAAANLPENNPTTSSEEEAEETEEEVATEAEEEAVEETEEEEVTEEEFVSKIATFSPAHDAHLDDGTPFNEAVMRLDTDRRISYLLFDLSAIDSVGGYITDATLRFTVNTDGGDGEIVVYKGLTNDWTETSIEASTAPENDIELGRIEKTYSIGITQEILLSASDIIPEKTTLILDHTFGNDLAIASKEHPSEDIPVLVIGYEAPESAGDVGNNSSGNGNNEGGNNEGENNEAPVASASANPLNGTAPLDVSFNGSNSTDDKGISSYSWNFKDGSSSSQQNPQHTFTEAGTYQVVLTVTDEEGLTDSDTVTINVSESSNEAPVAVANANPQVGDAPLSVSFSSSESTDDNGIVSYFWDFGTNDPSSAQAPNRTFDTPGVYNVTLTVTDAQGLTSTDTVTITVNEGSGSGGSGGGGNIPPGAVLASSFGYNSSNATQALQDAIKSNNSVIVIDKQSSDWIIEPSKFFNLSNKTIIFEDGVTVRAKSGAYGGTDDRLLEFVNAINVDLEGYGATLRMNKSEYTNGEGRHALSLVGCRDVNIRGFHIRDSGGDGIYFGGSSSGSYSENVTVEDVISQNNRRMGITFISAENVTVRNSEFIQSSGTNPETGVQFEPNNPSERLVNIVFVNCKFSGNNSNGLHVAVNNLNSSSRPISIYIRDSEFSYNSVSNSSNKPKAEVLLGAGNHGNQVGGHITFERVEFNGSNRVVLFSKKPADAYDAIFRDCEARNVIKGVSSPPIILEAHSQANTLGGFTFDDFYMEYTKDEPFLRVSAPSNYTLKDIVGNFTIKEPGDNPPEFINGANPSNGVNVNISYNHIN